MGSPPDSPGFNQFLIDGVFDRIIGIPLPAAPTPQATRSQLLYPLLTDTPAGTPQTGIIYDASQGVFQDSYLPFQNIPHSSHVSPRTTIASFDSSIRAVQWNESSGMDSSGVSRMWSPTVVPVIPQPAPSPSSPSTSTYHWFEVPQRVYGHGHRQWDFKQSEPIYFNVDGSPGMNLEDAFHKRFTGLDGRDEHMLQNSRGAISCRFLFLGYPDGSAQISTFDWAKRRTRITRSKLVYEVAKKLNQYLKSMSERAMDESVDKQWKVGAGFMQLRNMYLVRLVSVSTGSFQPEIWIRTS